MSVTDSIFLRIGRATSSKKAWEILKAEFGETNEIRNLKLTSLEIKFNEMMMKNEGSVWDYIEKLMELVNQLKLYGLTCLIIKSSVRFLAACPQGFMTL
ncbi:hypothetical protein Bca101_082611 [Brassica carinata]